VSCSRRSRHSIRSPLTLAAAQAETLFQIRGKECATRIVESCYRRRASLLTASMLPTKLHVIDLQAGAPELGAPELTELRIVIRPFPKDAAERNCYQYLLEQMQASPDHAAGTKVEFERICRRRFRVMVGSFEYCWREAIKASGACWDQPGRRPN
jgi:hypothetical protein